MVNTKARQWLLDAGTKNNDPNIDKLINDMDNGDNDISWIGYMVGMTSALNSTAIKAVDNAVRNCNTDTQQETLKFGKKLVFQYSKLQKKHGKNFTKIYYELDKNGNPTGNFVRDLNWGQHTIDYKQLMADLTGKYKLERDAEGYPIRPVYGDKKFD